MKAQKKAIKQEEKTKKFKPKIKQTSSQEESINE